MPKQQEPTITVKTLSRVCEQTTGTQIYHKSTSFAKQFLHLFFLKVQFIKGQKCDQKLKRPFQAERKIRGEAEIYKLLNP